MPLQTNHVQVRLILWYQYDEFAEMCSHTWPEEPLKPPKTVSLERKQPVKHVIHVVCFSHKPKQGSRAKTDGCGHCVYEDVLLLFAVILT